MRFIGFASAVTAVGLLFLLWRKLYAPWLAAKIQCEEALRVLEAANHHVDDPQTLCWECLAWLKGHANEFIENRKLKEKASVWIPTVTFGLLSKDVLKYSVTGIKNTMGLNGNDLDFDMTTLKENLRNKCEATILLKVREAGIEDALENLRLMDLPPPGRNEMMLVVFLVIIILMIWLCLHQRDRVMEKKQDLTKLTDEVNTRKYKAQDLEAFVQNVATTHEELENALKEKASELEQAQDDIRGLKIMENQQLKSGEDLNSQLKQVETEMQSGEGKLDSLAEENNELQCVNERLICDMEVLKEQLSSSEIENQNLNKQKENAESTIYEKEMKINTLGSETDNLRSCIETLTAENRLLNELALEKELELKSATENSTKISVEIEKLKGLQNQQDERQTLEDQIRNITEEIRAQQKLLKEQKAKAKKEKALLEEWKEKAKQDKELLEERKEKARKEKELLEERKEKEKMEKKLLEEQREKTRTEKLLRKEEKKGKKNKNDAADVEPTVSKQGRSYVACRHGERLDQQEPGWYETCINKRKNTYEPPRDRQDTFPESLPSRKIMAEYELDTPLTSRGTRQAFTLGKKLASSGKNIVAIYSSPAFRSIQTAHFIAQGAQAGDKPIHVDTGLLELGSVTETFVPNYMTDKELIAGGYNIATNYNPHIQSVKDLDPYENLFMFQWRQHETTLYCLEDAALYQREEGKENVVLLVGHQSTIAAASNILMKGEPEPEEQFHYNLSLGDYLCHELAQEMDNVWHRQFLDFAEKCVKAKYYDRRNWKFEHK